MILFKLGVAASIDKHLAWEEMAENDCLTWLQQIKYISTDWSLMTLWWLLDPFLPIRMTVL